MDKNSTKSKPEVTRIQTGKADEAKFKVTLGPLTSVGSFINSETKIYFCELSKFKLFSVV